jgi:hypothetical protein
MAIKVKQYKRKDGTKVSSHKRSEPQSDLKYSANSYKYKKSDKSKKDSQSFSEMFKKEKKIDDLGLKGWKLTALKELTEQESEEFTDAKDESYDNRFQDRDGLYLEGYGEYIVFPSYEKAELSAIDYVKEQLDEEPELFTKDWLNQFIYVSDTDRRIIAGEQEDNLRNEMIDEGIDENSAEFEERADAIYDEWYNGLQDPIQFLVEEQEIYSMEDLLQQSFIQIDTNEASEDAVNTDGVAHFFASYDGNQIELPSGAVAYRVN